MISSFLGLQTSLKGLLAQQQALDVAAHNVANANTVGYTRQEATLGASDPLQLDGVGGGSSLNRNFVTGQLNPQPTEVMARNIRPAGAIRAGAVGFDSVMEPGKGWNRPSPCRLSAAAATGPRT